MDGAPTHRAPDRREDAGLRGAYALLGLVMSAFIPFLTLLLRDRGLSPDEIGLVLAVLSVSGVAAAPFWSHIADTRLGTVRTLQLACAAASVFALGLILTGSVAGLLFAYLVRFLAVGSQSVEASLARIPRSLDEAAQSLGARGVRTLRALHLPLARRGLLVASALVFVDVMKELPATLLLRPFGLETLAVVTWRRTAESLWVEAAVPALALVLAGLGPVLLAMRATGAETRAGVPPPPGPAS
jgi:ABC-type Fe3+ transport system permease subunit